MTNNERLKAFAEDAKQLCRDYSSRAGSVYINDVLAALDGLLEQHLTEDGPDSFSVYFGHDNHTFTRLKGATIDEILADADRIEASYEGSHGSLCQLILLKDGKEFRRVGPMAHARGHKDPKDHWEAGKAKWRAAVEADPDVMRLLTPENMISAED